MDKVLISMNKTYLQEKENFYSLLEEELNIYHNIENIMSKTLNELHLTKPEIDLFLNRLETTYKVFIEEGEIQMNFQFGDLMEKIVVNTRTTTG